jgi:glycosyltransferase involved in cell wall biosynthesis
MNKKVSYNPITIITPTKDCRSSLRDTILSVQKHKNKNIEFIIIDGYSTDGTVELIKEFDGCVDYWISEEDLGIYDAMNKGWAIVSKDRYVLFLGAGDKLLSLPNEDLSKHKNKVIYGRVQMGGKMQFVSKLNKISRFANTIHHQGLLLHKSLHVGQPFNLKYKVYADFDLIQRLIKMKLSFVYLDSLLTYAKPGGISGNYSKDVYRIAYKNFGLLYGIASLMFYCYQKIKTNKNNSLMFRKQY